MAGTRGSNTMTEQLRGLLGQLAEMKAAPDADIAYLTNLETQVLKFLRAPFEKQRLEAQLGPAPTGGTAQAAMNAAAPPEMGAPPMGPGGAAPSPAMQLLFPPPPRVPGVMRGASMPPVDELRRLMEQPAL